MSMVVSPLSAAEAADVVRAHAQNGHVLSIHGGNTRSLFGHGVNAQTALSSVNLTGITAYNPAEMVMTVRAGTPLAEVEAALAANNQMLAFEPIDHRHIMGTKGLPTIGGVFAVNASGPRRFVSGAARDSLLGIEFINGNAELIRAGGRVMKNVTGLDLVKLLAGSFGTLGFITEVTFRVLPCPLASKTLVISGLEEDQAAHVMATAMATPMEVTAAAHLPESVKYRFLGGALPTGQATLLRLEGLPDSVSARLTKLKLALERSGGAMSVLDEDDTHLVWADIRDVKPYSYVLDKPLWRVSVAPSVGHQLVAALRLQAGIDAFYDWQGGLVWMQMEASAEPELLRSYIQALGGGHAVLIREGNTYLADFPKFQPLSEAERILSHRIKSKLDPAHIFNRGKMGI